MEKEEIKHEIGDLISMSMNLSKPIPMNFEDMSFNKLCLMTGKNGTGKSVIMKLNWIMNIVASYCVLEQESPGNFNFCKEVDYLFNHTFDDNDFTGTISCTFQNLEVSIVLEEGECTSQSFSTTKKLALKKPAMYLSSETRLISDIVKYMKFKKLLKIFNVSQLYGPDLEKVLEMYKIYDVIFMEAYIEKINGYIITEEVQKSLDKLECEGMKFSVICVDYDKCSISDVDGEKITDLCKLSAGQQAVFVMTTANGILN